MHYQKFMIFWKQKMYNEFSKIYDTLMSDVDYEKWVEYILQIFDKYGQNLKEISKVLDVACGTGNISLPLSKLGYIVYGVDISDNMLAIAENKARRSNQNITFKRQDMRNLKLSSRFDFINSSCDGINYIIKEKELLETFLGFHKLLNKNGLLIFDISSYFKLRFILGNNTIFEEKNNICYCWENSFDNRNSIIKMKLNFFIPQGNLYHRFEETHIQKAYKKKEIVELLKKSGFTILDCYGDFTFEPPNEWCERIFFVAIKD